MIINMHAHATYNAPNAPHLGSHMQLLCWPCNDCNKHPHTHVHPCTCTCMYTYTQTFVDLYLTTKDERGSWASDYYVCMQLFEYGFTI